MTEHILIIAVFAISVVVIPGVLIATLPKRRSERR